MNKEDREVLGGIIGLGSGAVGGIWLVSWLFHLGPDTEQWWAMAYYLTAIAGSVAGWVLSAAAIYFAVQRIPLSASAEGGE